MNISTHLSRDNHQNKQSSFCQQPHVSLFGLEMIRLGIVRGVPSHPSQSRVDFPVKQVLRVLLLLVHELSNSRPVLVQFRDVSIFLGCFRDSKNG